MDRSTNFEVDVWGEKGQRSYRDMVLDEHFFTYVARVDLLLNRAKEKKAVSYKCVGAYFRTLSFDNPSREQVEKAFACILEGIGTKQDAICVQDYMMHKFLQLAEKN